MRDDKFNNLMKKYVDSTKLGEDLDLHKLKNKNQSKVNEHSTRTKFVWATCAVVLIVVISLSITLPIVLNKEKEPQYYYCDLLNISKNEINDFSDLIDQHKFSCMLPAINFIDSYMYIMINKDDNKEIGAFISLAVYDENFDSIMINVLNKQYIMTQFEYFDDFVDIEDWRGVTIKYLISEKNETRYSYEMTFTIGNYNYFINFDSLGEMSLTEALDMIYSENVS